EELKEQLKGLSPAERQAKVRELREKYGLGPVGEEGQKRLAEFRKLKESMKDLPPAERQAKIREWREKNGGSLPGTGVLSPEEREKYRKQFSKRVGEQLEVLKKKRGEGGLNDVETRRLRRMEEMGKRLE